MPDLPEDRLAALRDMEPERPTLPAAEVRRRGDRHRRIRTSVTVGAAALAVLVIAGGVSAMTPGDGQTAPDPIDTPTPSATESPLPSTIPDDVPLDAGLPGENLEGTPVEVTDEPGVRAIEACGETILDADGALDVAGVAYEGGEDYRYRTLILLDSAAAARDLVDETADIVAGCPSQEVQGGTELLEPLDSTLGSGSVAFMTRFENAGSPLTNPATYHLVPFSNAVLITSAGGEAGNTPDGLASAADFAAKGAAEVLAALTGDDPASETALPVSTEIPAGLELGVGLPDESAEIDVVAPSEDAEGLGELDLCGSRVWPPSQEYADRLATTASGPEYFEARELWVYPDAAAASAALAPVRGAVADCPTDDGRRWETMEADTGYDSVTVGLFYTQGLGSATYQWTRVGAAVLLVHRAGEGTREGLPADADRATALTGQLVPELCLFTADGC